MSLTGFPLEGRQPFPSVNKLRPVFPNRHVSGRTARNSKSHSVTAGEFGYAHRRSQQQGRVPEPVTASLREPQEQAELVHHATSNSSASPANHSTGSTRIPHLPGAVDTFSRFEQN